MSPISGVELIPENWGVDSGSPVIDHLNPRGRDDFKSRSRGDSIVVSILWCPAPEIVAIIIYCMQKHHIFNTLAPENVLGLFFHILLYKCKPMTFSGATALKI